MQRRNCTAILSLASLALCASVCVGADGPDAFRSSVKPFLEKNCFECHSGDKLSGDFDLKKAVLDDPELKDRDVWNHVLERVERGEMPPDTKPRPDEKELATVTQWLASQLHPTVSGGVARITTRRLNRTEYNNTVRDLLGVDLRPADDFPPDDAGYGFDNIGDVLSMSPMLMEKYLKAAESVARTALFGVENLKPSTITHQPWYIDFDTTRAVRFEYDETGLSMPYGVHVMHRFPVEADYDLSAIMRGFRPGGADPVRLGFWLDGKMIQEGQVPVPAGGELNGLYYRFRTRIPAGEHWMAISVLKIYEGLPPAYEGPNPNQSSARVSKSPTEFFVQNLVVTGPFNQVQGPTQESLKKFYACGHLDGHHDPGCARKILTDFLHRAYRRPATEDEISEELRLVEMVQKNGDSFEEGLCVAIEKALISPQFLFRLEGNPLDNQTDPKLTPHELATRLSYFLWSTTPDEELLRAADDGSLAKPAVQEAQVRRMLKDPKIDQLVENFGGQWLQFRALESHNVERKKFQQYTDYTIMSMQKETGLFFQNIIQEDRSVLDFIDANYTFLNQRLAEFYGIPDVKGPEFRKVELPAATRRGGVLTQASVLTVSSYATRTSPVIRGKWILENILNSAPPPPPPNVPSLKEDEVGAVSMREMLQKHRENPSCAGCHARMDPLGFSLENFDAIGAWREKDGQLAIDTSGELPSGRKFDGPDELRKIVLEDKDAFARCIAEKMLTFAIGRGVTRDDQPAITSIAGQMAREDYRFSTLVLGVINSPQFQLRGESRP
jgi:mono/diheme cytochrome c family protein